MCEEGDDLQPLGPGEGPGGSRRSVSTNTVDNGGEDTEALKEKVDYLQLKLEEVQGESSLLKEWGARIELYIDCLGDALERHNISHVSDVDGSLVSLEECRQKAKTLPHTKKPHCDEDLRTKQYDAELEKLRQEIATLRSDQEDSALQRNSEQEVLLMQIQAAEYHANSRWEVYHETAMQQWGQTYSQLQMQYNETMGQLNQLRAAYDNLKGATNHGRQIDEDSFINNRRNGPAAVDSMHGDEEVMKPPGQYHRHRPMTAAFRPHGHYQDKPARSCPDNAPILLRAERTEILRQYFANLDMIQRQQDSVGWQNRQQIPPQRPGPHGEN
ncbi:uncharacterized protein [Asterias amurensis]|uniref:uncharacterized protein n=1 Tax=Asterias amurensis TaxID=7602 RepID=UPI003AB5E38A